MQPLELVQSKGLEYKLQGKDLLIKCLNPDHPDSNPSLRIDKLTGIGHCFSCGFKINIFKFFGIVTDKVNTKVRQVKAKIDKIYSDEHGLEIPKGAQPYRRPWRGLSAETLEHFQAFRHKDFEGRVVFPLRDITGKIRAFVGRLEESNVGARYQIYPPGASVPLFPERVQVVNNTAVIVEGSLDMMNLWDKGVKNVVAMMGTQGLGSIKGLQKDKITTLKLQGITKLVLLMDGDDAGRKAADILKPLLEREDLTVEVIELDEGDDPGSLCEEEVKLLKRYI